MNGETLIMLANHGSLEQMQACDLKTVRQQMDSRKRALSALSLNSSINASTSSLTTNVDDRKLSMTAMKQMKKEEKYIYLIK